MSYDKGARHYKHRTLLGWIIHSKIYIAPLQGNDSEALPTTAQTKR